MTFSWAQTLLRAKAMKLRHAKALATNQDKEYKLKHPDESRDASQKNYTKLTLRINKEFEDNYNKAVNRRKKINGSD